MNIKLKLFLFSILISASSLSFAIDTDRDTLPDDWEIANGRDPLIEIWHPNARNGDLSGDPYKLNALSEKKPL